MRHNKGYRLVQIYIGNALDEKQTVFTNLFLVSKTFSLKKLFSRLL